MIGAPRAPGFLPGAAPHPPELHQAPMKQETPAILPDDIYQRTEAGNAAVGDMQRALSAGFREMLKAVDGKRKVAQLGASFPRLDEEDISLWLGELLRMGLIDVADVPFELPELKAARPPAAGIAQAGAAVPPGGGGVDEFDIAAMTANVEEWLRQDTESPQLRQSATELNKTIQAAALQSTQALATLQDSGFFANLMDPLKLAGRQPPTGREPVRESVRDSVRDSPAAPTIPMPAAAPAARAANTGVAPMPSTPVAVTPAGAAAPRPASPRRGLVLVYESDPADNAMLARLLTEVGYQAQLCSARQQLVLLLNQPVVPEVIFLKQGAKDVDVLKVLEKLRAHPRLGKVPVVMMADKPSREDIAKSILLGASGWMVKPYSAEVIRAAVQGVLTFPSA